MNDRFYECLSEKTRLLINIGRNILRLMLTYMNTVHRILVLGKCFLICKFKMYLRY